MQDPDRRDVLIGIGGFLVAGVASPVAALSRNPDDPAPRTAAIRVMSYNIARGVGTDGVYDLQRITDVIAAVNPDVIALQEVEDQNRASWNDDSLSNYDAQHKLLAERLGMRHIVFAANRDWRKAEGMASWTEKEKQAGYRRRMGDVILSRKPIIESTVFEYDANTRFNPPYQHVQGRKLTEALLDVGGSRIWFYNTHLQPGSGPLQIERRTEQMQQLLQIAGKRSGPKILAGDFNFPDGRHGWRKDSFPTPRDYDAVTERYTDALRKLDSDAPTAGIPPLRWGPVRLDYIFTSGNFAIEAGKTIVYETEPNGPLPSDHRPIMVEISVPQRRVASQGAG